MVVAVPVDDVPPMLMLILLILISSLTIQCNNNPSQIKMLILQWIGWFKLGTRTGKMTHKVFSLRLHLLPLIVNEIRRMEHGNRDRLTPRPVNLLMLE